MHKNTHTINGNPLTTTPNDSKYNPSFKIQTPNPRIFFKSDYTWNLKGSWNRALQLTDRRTWLVSSLKVALLELKVQLYYTDQIHTRGLHADRL